MIDSILGAMSLTAKLGISIAVFAVFIVVEILALVMLVKWKKNYKPVGVSSDADKANADQSADQSAEASDVESIDNGAENQADFDASAQQEQENQDASAESSDISDVDAQSDDQVEETQSAEELQQTDIAEQNEDASIDVVARDSAEPVEESETAVEGEEGALPKEDKMAAFAFAPLMLMGVPVVTGMRTFLYVLIGISMALAAGVFVTSLIFAKSLKKSPEKDKIEEQPKQELPVEEPVEPTPVEEQVEEIVEEEPVVEETHEEEIAAEEQPVEDTDEQEADVEEEVVEDGQVEEISEPVEDEQEQPVEDTEEEIEEIEEEPIVEEEEESVAEEIQEEEIAAEEQPVEETDEQESDVEEEQPDEEAEDEDKPEVRREPPVREKTVTIDDKTVLIKDDRFLFNPEEDGYYYLLEKTFTAKLIQSEEFVKDYYTELKNELLSYKKVHARMSKKRESFNFGRVCLARMSIRGKTLRIHLALDAAAYEETKYKVEDTSDVVSLADTPLMYRIKNDRRLKYAKDLIAAVMERYGVEKEDVQPDTDYTSQLPYETTEALLARGLIIKRRVKGRPPIDNGVDVDDRCFTAKLIQSEDLVKEYYSRIKNELLAYRKVHDRMSRKRETYRFGRTCVARMSIRGKTLKLYLALNAADYDDTKYKVEDASDIKSVEDTPLMYKIKNDRRLDYAMELIATAMAGVGAVKKREKYIIAHDYAADMPYEDDDSLEKRGLIVKKHVKGTSFIAQRIAESARRRAEAMGEAAADLDDED